jgi:hypothetical protein
MDRWAGTGPVGNQSLLGGIARTTTTLVSNKSTDNE